MRSRSPFALFALLAPVAVACGAPSGDPSASHADAIYDPNPTPTAVPTTYPPLHLAWSPSTAMQRRLRILSGLPTIMPGLLTTMSGTFLGKGPTMAFGLVLDDGLFYGQGFAHATLGASSAADPTADTVYRMGSQNKAITATAMMRVLEQYPSVHATDLASKYVSDASSIPWPVGETHAGAPPITLKDLVSHTSGLPNYGGAAYASGVNVLSPTEPQFLAMLHHANLEFDPGTRRDYSGLGMTLAGIAIEKITGQAYRPWTEAQILAPLGMTSTTFDPSTIPASSIAPRFDVNGAAYTATTAPFLDIGALAPAGQLFTTIRDMSKLMVTEISSADAASVPDTFLLKRADLVTTQTDQFPSATTAGSEPCGYGWWLNGGGEGYVHHNGGIDDYASNLFFSPSKKIGLTVLISAEDSTNTDVILPPILDAAVQADLTDDWHQFPLPMAVERMMSLVNDGYDASSASNFHDLHLRAGVTVQSMIQSWQSLAGSCATFAVDRLYSATKGDFTFACSKKTVKVSLTATASAPYLVSSVSEQ